MAGWVIYLIFSVVFLTAVYFFEKSLTNRANRQYIKKRIERRRWFYNNAEVYEAAAKVRDAVLEPKRAEVLDEPIFERSAADEIIESVDWK